MQSTGSFPARLFDSRCRHSVVDVELGHTFGFDLSVGLFFKVQWPSADFKELLDTHCYHTETANAMDPQNVGQGGCNPDLPHGY